MNKQSIYERLGIDPDKAVVREIFEKVINNKHPGAFVNIIPDPINSDYSFTHHVDGDGSKFVQCLLYFLVTGKSDIFKSIVDNALSMNTGDVACAGFVGPYTFVDILNVKMDEKLKKILLLSVACRAFELMELYKKNDINLKFLGGETADLPDQVRSGIFDISINAWTRTEDLITGNVKVGDKIYGFASDGKATWEDEINSGIMSNGLTLGRSALMHEFYDIEHPITKREGSFYDGRFYVNDKPEILTGMTVGEALLSPTRQWAIVIKKLLTYLKKMDCLSLVHGISMNTGGGATKIKNVCKGGICYHKKMPKPPAIFQLIQSESKEEWKDMFKGFNCGVGLDIVGSDNPKLHEALKQTARECNISLYELGFCESAESKKKNEIILETLYGEWRF